jgi:3-oxoacyl-[acyl-carrier protein] reductase
MDLGLKDRVALVAASSKGLGFAAALELAKEGAKVVLSGRDGARLNEAVAQINQAVGREVAAGLAVDVTDPTAVNELVEYAVGGFGRLDILITNAGGPPGGTFDSLDAAAWEKGFNLTLLSAANLIRAALPYLRQSDAASILTITSVSAKQPIAGLLLSNVMRPAVSGLTKTLSQELGREGIRVNSILPGWTATERVEEIMAYRTQQNNTSKEAEVAKITNSIPLGRMGRPEEFGRVAAFLVSPAASYVNGVMMQVDGGSYGGLM